MCRPLARFLFQVLDKISDVFEGSNYMIVEDSRLSP